MNKKIAIFTIIITSLICFNIGFSELSDNIKFHYAFEESSGNPVDSSGLTTASANGISYSQTGVIGNCFSFDGSNDNIITNLNYDTIPISVNLWTKSDNTKGASQGNMWGNDNGGYDFGLVEHDSEYSLFYGNGRYDTGSEVSTGNWKMITITIQSGISSIYVDGEFISSTSYGVNANGGVWTIASNVGGADYFYDGLLDEITLWNRILSTDEIEDLYNDGDGLEYPFEVEEEPEEPEDYNITLIEDKTPYNYFLYNTTAQLTYNSTGTNSTQANWTNALTLIIEDFNINQTLKSMETQNVLVNNTNEYFDALVYNTFNHSQNETFRYYTINIAEYLGLIYNNTNILINITQQLIDDVNSISNFTLPPELNETLQDILNNTEQNYEEITFIKKIQLCVLKQYTTIEEYNYYCEEWKPFNPFRARDIKEVREGRLNVSMYLLNASIAEQESVNLNVRDCYDTQKYLNLLNSTDYFVLNAVWAGSSYLIDNSVCWIKWGLKAMSVIK